MTEATESAILEDLITNEIDQLFSMPTDVRITCLVQIASNPCASPHVLLTCALMNVEVVTCAVVMNSSLPIETLVKWINAYEPVQANPVAIARVQVAYRRMGKVFDPPVRPNKNMDLMPWTTGTTFPMYKFGGLSDEQSQKLMWQTVAGV